MKLQIAQPVTFYENDSGLRIQQLEVHEALPLEGPFSPADVQMVL